MKPSKRLDRASTERLNIYKIHWPQYLPSKRLDRASTESPIEKPVYSPVLYHQNDSTERVLKDIAAGDDDEKKENHQNDSTERVLKANAELSTAAGDVAIKTTRQSEY